MPAYRAITKEAVAAFIAGESFNKANTEVRIVERPGETLVELLLHDNPIARRWGNGLRGGPWTEVTTAGWDTVTTRERLNGIPGVSVHRAKSILHLNDKPWHGAWTVVTPTQETRA
jgi:hypothetical protein